MQVEPHRAVRVAGGEQVDSWRRRQLRHLGRRAATCCQCRRELAHLRMPAADLAWCKDMMAMQAAHGA